MKKALNMITYDLTENPQSFERDLFIIIREIESKYKVKISIYSPVLSVIFREEPVRHETIGIQGNEYEVLVATQNLVSRFREKYGLPHSSLGLSIFYLSLISHSIQWLKGRKILDSVLEIYRSGETQNNLVLNLK